MFKYYNFIIYYFIIYFVIICQDSNFDHILLANEMCKIRKMLCLDDIYISGFIIKYEHIVTHLKYCGFHIIDEYYNHIGAQLVKKQSFYEPKYTMIIAEIGYNHQGDINIAKKIIIECKNANVDIVKLQKQDMGINGRFTQEILNRPYKSTNSFVKLLWTKILLWMGILRHFI